MNNKVMIIDDNEYIRESIEILFRAKRINVLTASGGEECLHHLEAGFRGVLLMDIMMPEMDGWDTIRQMVARGLYEGNTILMLTAMGEPDGRMEEIQKYVTDYLTKPFNPTALLEAVEYYHQLLVSGSTDVRQ
ncbi:response receiver CheY associated with MCPs of class 36H [Geotalea daltonii FRC-32]|uniref:Response receiver CheY associated with MCPs of class 36H n=1 Tax=Geotalea daltonii (strain DSM 22248 / JCM 15807 / FRC-32) TaxID=316067 RepID=B9M717_GEODF|nr:response regulator [Geotalea daltonii]ACM22038.1 response receiver CheY associated with MCPs of class 36H [Geotalea daltonii FRC-32]